MTVVIVEDQSMFLGFLRKICVTEFGYRVQGEAKTIREGIELCRSHQPKLVLLDIDLPDGNALDVLQEFENASPASRILAISALDDDYTMIRVLDSGVHGFVDKRRSSLDALWAAIQTVIQGDTYFSPAVMRARERVISDPRSWFKILTPHQVGLLRLIGNGSSNAEVAAVLGRSSRTIEKHRQLIMAKLGVHSVRALIRYAVRHGLAEL